MRPKTATARRTNSVKAKVTPAEAAEIAARAAAANRSVSDYLRLLGLGLEEPEAPSRGRMA